MYKNSMILATCLLVLNLPGMAIAQGADLTRFTHPDSLAQDLAKLDTALDAISSLTASFTQISPEGVRAQGELYLQRPGKLRIDYNPPENLLIISDGLTLTQIDEALQTRDTVALSSTPVYFFLKNKVNIARDTKVVGLHKTDRFISVTAQDKDGRSEDQVTLVFNRESLGIHAWVITDGLGGHTQVLLSENNYNTPINPRLFIARDKDQHRQRRR